MDRKIGNIILVLLLMTEIISAIVFPGPCGNSSECTPPDVCTTEGSCVCPLPNVGVVGTSCHPCMCTKPNECCASDGTCKCLDFFIRDNNGDCSACPTCNANEVCVIPTDTGVPTCMCAEETFKIGDACLGCPTCGIGEACVIKPSGPTCQCKEGRWRVAPDKCIKKFSKPWGSKFSKPWGSKFSKPWGSETCTSCGKSKRKFSWPWVWSLNTCKDCGKSSKGWSFGDFGGNI